MARSHSELKRWYANYNRFYFGGKLPRDMDVFYAPDDRVHGLAVKDVNGNCTIQIDTALMGTRYAKWTLLHEMAHHATGDWGHGKRFQAQMLRLAIMGAFKKIW